MTRRTWSWFGVIAVLVVVGTTLFTLIRLGVLSVEAMVSPPRQTITLDLPERGGRLDLSLTTNPVLAPYVSRHLTVERAGQAIIDTPLFPARLDPRFGLGLIWVPAEGRAGPWVRLADSAGDVLLDLRGFTARRVIDHGGRAWLVAPSGPAVAGDVTGPEDGAETPTQGVPLTLPAAAEGVLLGHIVADGGTLVFQRARADDAPLD